MKSILERQKQESAKDYVLRVLIHNIVNTELVPGERLIDQEICGQLGVSRTPFREAELELARCAGDFVAGVLGPYSGQLCRIERKTGRAERRPGQRTGGQQRRGQQSAKQCAHGVIRKGIEGRGWSPSGENAHHCMRGAWRQCPAGKKNPAGAGFACWSIRLRPRRPESCRSWPAIPSVRCCAR